MDITEFYDTFFEEADELLAEMESHLLELDVDNPDVERLNAMHATSTRLPTVRQEALAEFLEGGQAACLPASTARTRIEQVARFGSAPRTARSA